MLWGGRNTANKYHWRVRGVLSVWTTLGLPQIKVAHASWVYTAQAPGYSAGELSKAGPAFPAFPRSKPLMFRFVGTPQRCILGWAFVLCPSQVRAVQATRCLVSAVSPRWGICLITSPVPAAGFSGCLQVHLLRCAVCLFWGADLWLRPS